MANPLNTIVAKVQGEPTFFEVEDLAIVEVIQGAGAAEPKKWLFGQCSLFFIMLITNILDQTATKS